MPFGVMSGVTPGIHSRQKDKHKHRPADGLGECSIQIPRTLAILIESDALKTVLPPVKHLNENISIPELSHHANQPATEAIHDEKGSTEHRTRHMQLASGTIDKKSMIGNRLAIRVHSKAAPLLFRNESYTKTLSLNTDRV